MQPVPEILEIEKQLSLDEIDWVQAAKSIAQIAKKKKPWQTPEWESERERLIQSSCAQCTSSDGEMVLQHLWHPRSMGNIFLDLAGSERWEKFKADYDREIGADLLEERDVCPACGSLNIKPLKTQSIWRCYRCKEGVEEPLREMVFSFEGRKTLSERKKKNGKLFRFHRWRKFQALYGTEFGKQAVLAAIEESRRYLSLSDTVTFCKKCAFLWDVEKIMLCRSCKNEWHSMLYKKCKVCRGRN